MCLLYAEACVCVCARVCVRFWPRPVSHLPVLMVIFGAYINGCVTSWGAAFLFVIPAACSEEMNEWREVTKDKRHCRARQGSARRGLHFPPDRIDKGHKGLARISLAPADPETRPSLWTQAKSANHNTVCHLSSLAPGLQVFALCPN